MKIRILDLAEQDLVEGFRFYEAQETGLGSYFLTNIYADIESLRLYAGVHEKPFKAYYRLLLVDSLSPSSILSRKASSQSMLLWIVVAIRLGLENGSRDLSRQKGPS